jgi:hypothetical protein
MLYIRNNTTEFICFNDFQKCEGVFLMEIYLIRTNLYY